MLRSVRGAQFFSGVARWRRQCTTAVAPPKKDQMKDEYGVMDSTGELYTTSKPFVLEGGQSLPSAQVLYQTYGTLNADRSNVIVVCHALTGNAALDSWWSPMLGDILDTSKYFVVCANILGSCYGSTGPATINPLTGKRYGSSFPEVTLRDTVRIHVQLLKEHLKVTQVKSVIGGSLGGMQALEWALEGGPDYVKSVVSIGCGAAHTAWQIGLSETQRQAIYADPKWKGGDFDPSDPPLAGLSVARQIAMLSYRTSASYEFKFGREVCEKTGRFQVQRYLEYQGKKFYSRFDAASYVAITKQMDTHDVGRGRGGVDAALASIRNKVCVVGIDSDILYPPREQKALAEKIPGSELHYITSSDGHDGFLLQVSQLKSIIHPFLDRE